ncbi:MAG: hypothetical protein ACRC31_04305, partial [Cetobacterium sp.]
FVQGSWQRGTHKLMATYKILNTILDAKVNIGQTDSVTIILITGSCKGFSMSHDRIVSKIYGRVFM